MDGKQGKPDVPVKPVRRSLKTIEPNIVNRRTQMFETGPEDNQKTGKVLPPQRPAPPKLAKRPASNEITIVPDVNKEIANEFTQKVAARKTIFDEDEKGSKQLATNADVKPTSPQRLPLKPKPPKPETKPKLPGADRERSASDSATSDLNTMNPTAKTKHFFVYEQTTRPKSDEIPVPKPRPTHAVMASHEEKKPVMPMYSVVDKSKMLQNRTADVESKSDDTCEDLESGPTTPPAKPPRTFEHDEYLKRKSLKKALKHKSSHTSYSRQTHHISDGLTEEPEESANGDAIFQDVKFSQGKTDTVSSQESCSHLYEEVGNPKHIYEEIGNRLSEDGIKPERPNPPPRPPNPKVGTLSRTKPATAAKPIHKTHVSDPSAVIKQKSLSNPGYGKEHEIIPIRTVFHGEENGGIKRSHSDECLYDSKLDLRESHDSEDEPVYQDPVDIIRPTGSQNVGKGVVIDAEGYAVPDMGSRTLGRQVRTIAFNNHVKKFSSQE